MKEVLEKFRQMVLKVKQSEGTRRSARLSSSEGKRAISVQKSKTKQKKKSAKLDAKIPKKPPTAFFYFLYVPSFVPFHLSSVVIRHVSPCKMHVCGT